MTMRKIPNRRVDFNTFMWLFTCLSALAMYGLILLALIGALLMGG